MENKAVSEIEMFMHNIAYLRKKYGFSKKTMSKLLGIGIHSLNLLEKGEMPPKLTANVIINVWKHFHIRPKDMFEQRLDKL